jgi:hypothetical protein
MTSPPSLSGHNILIVDGQSLSAADMSNRLVAMGAKVHVVPNAKCAIVMARAKRLDVALIGFRPQESSPELKHTLDLYGVPYIVCASASKQDHLNYEKVFSLTLPAAA